MSANLPKEGIGFEILTATELKTSLKGQGGKSIDLTEFDFHIKPTTYEKKITNSGYGVTVDLEARKDNFSYYIECKSSIDSNKILKINSQEFLKGILEFIALENLAENSNQKFRYLLVTNFPISKELTELTSHNNKIIKNLQKLVIKEGSSIYGKEFKKGVVTINRLRNIITNLSILKLDESLLAYKLKNDVDYQSIYNQFAQRLKQTESNNKTDTVVISEENFIDFSCKSHDHSSCIDIVIDNTNCHIGNMENLLKKIHSAYVGINNKSLITVPAKSFDYDINSIKHHKTLSTLDVALIISKAINAQLDKKENLIVYMIPGTYDLIIMNKEILCEKIKSTQQDAKYLLDKIEEMVGLGSYLKIKIAKMVLEETYGVIINDRNLISDESDDTNS